MTKRKIGAAVSMLALVAAAGAYAYWTQGGTGSGSATAGTTSNITVNQTSTVTGLYPGGPAASLSGNFDNPNSSPVTISSVTAAVTSVSPAGCATGNFSIGGSAGPISNIPSGTGVGSWSGLTIALAETGVNQDVCKGAVATISYTANP
jgi:hypothetical protein